TTWHSLMFASGSSADGRLPGGAAVCCGSPDGALPETWLSGATRSCILVYQSVASTLMTSILGAGWVTARVMPPTIPMISPSNHALGRQACRLRCARRPVEVAAIILSPVELVSSDLVKIVAPCALIWANRLCT